jgi:hypothetical protein
MVCCLLFRGLLWKRRVGDLAALEIYETEIRMMWIDGLLLKGGREKPTH